jgi:hypothetical protein
VISLTIEGNEYSHALNQAIEEAVALGFTIVAAAGGLATDACRFSPASVLEQLH